MPSLFKRANGIFYISYSLDGRRRWKSTGVSQRHLAINALLKFDKLIAQPKKRVLLSEFMADFLLSATTNYSTGTITIYKSALTKFLECVGDKWLGSIDPKHIDLYKTQRVKNLSPVTLNIELRTLRAAFYTAVRWKLITENPFRGVSLLRIPDQQPIHLTKEEFRKLISGISETWFRDLIIVAVYTGLRRGELLNMLWKDVDFKRKVIYVQSNSNFRTKTGKRRTVPMNKDVVVILLRRFQSLKNDLVFTRDAHKILESHVTHKFKVYIRKTELNEELHFHSLRHTFATWLVQGGINIYEVQKLLGHSSIKITEIYSHLATSELHWSVDKIRVPALN